MVAELQTENAELAEESARKDDQLRALNARLTKTLANFEKLEKQLE